MGCKFCPESRTLLVEKFESWIIVVPKRTSVCGSWTAQVGVLPFSLFSYFSGEPKTEVKTML